MSILVVDSDFKLDKSIFVLLLPLALKVNTLSSKSTLSILIFFKLLISFLLFSIFELNTFVVFYLINEEANEVYMNDSWISALGLNYKKYVRKIDEI